MLSSQSCAELSLEDSNWYSVLWEELYLPDRNAVKQLMASVRSSLWAPVCSLILLELLSVAFW